MASESNELKELINNSKDIPKSTFQNSLDSLIAESINFRKEYLDLAYDNKTDYGLIEKLLLLFNVETIRQKSDETMRFPFDKHKQEDWSLEHIHAQQSEGLNRREQWVEWLRLQSDNSALNNSTFDVKRNKILEMDKTSDYIPVCTRRVFLKYYTTSESNQVHFWGNSDRHGYMSEMNTVLSPYLTLIQKEIKL